MELLFDQTRGPGIRVSFVLLDWSCRESLHILDYLNDQTLPRDQYEIIWIEYYQKHSADLLQRIAVARDAGARPPVDAYAILGMPQSVYYHKHLLYNAGIAMAKGQIICICDSDAFMRPTFAEAIVRQFEADPNIVLHMDEVRNNDRSFYPFNHPDFEDVVGPGCATWINGRPLGLADSIDPLHTRNYGACMCAQRSDLIAIGGADMHLDYLGHICGPYELTFRLVNAGKREIWHDREWLYHVWHPGQAGDRNYAGPHDGRHMSTTALQARQTGRVLPLVPHPAITKLARGASGNCRLDLDDLVVPEWLDEWDVRGVETRSATYQLGRSEIALMERAGPADTPVETPAAAPASPFDRRPGRMQRAKLAPLVFGLLFRQFQLKYRMASLRYRPPGVRASLREPFRKVRAAWGFLQRMLDYNRHRMRVCWLHLCYVASLGYREVVLYGDGDAARILSAMAESLHIRIRAICPIDGSPVQQRRYESWSEDRLVAYPGAVILAVFVNSAEHVQRLEQLGCERDRLIVLE
jgi:hypothetical protein